MEKSISPCFRHCGRRIEETIASLNMGAAHPQHVRPKPTTTATNPRHQPPNPTTPQEQGAGQRTLAEGRVAGAPDPGATARCNRAQASAPRGSSFGQRAMSMSPYTRSILPSSAQEAITCLGRHYAGLDNAKGKNSRESGQVDNTCELTFKQSKIASGNTEDKNTKGGKNSRRG